jgi:predicted O-methyltransferase YrrM
LPNYHPYQQYLKHLLKAKNRYGIHSPFVYALLENVIYKKGHYYNYDVVNAVRTKMKRDNRMISIEDLGAGSKKLANQRKIKNILSTSVKSKKTGEMLYRLAVDLNPSVTLELGTSLGLTTAYFALANKKGKVYTIEGDPETRKIALENFKAMNLDNVISLEGNFNTVLPDFCRTIDFIDLAYIDGNHRKEPTIRYVREILPKLKNGSCLILDDIYWSKEMTEAWQEIISWPEFQVSLDLFEIGILFIRKEQEKQLFRIRF